MLPLDDIRKSFRGRIALGEPLARYTTFRIGGPADLYLEPVDKEDALALVRTLRATGVPSVVMGNGSNLLVADDGVSGVVINLESGFGAMRIEENGEIVAGAGVRLAQFVDFCIRHHRGGTEMLAGIPGTLGGAIIMNAGAYGGEISDHMLWVDIVRNGELVRITREEGGFAYRTSNLAGTLVLEAGFRFPDGNRDTMREQRRATMLKRNTSQPVQWPNAGSIFKNPPGDYAARLIEACGLKGRRAGGAEISELHANFIINREGATARDVIELIRIARAAVEEQFGVRLELEVKLVGFEGDPVGAAPGTSGGDQQPGEVAW